MDKMDTHIFLNSFLAGCLEALRAASIMPASGDFGLWAVRLAGGVRGSGVVDMV